VASGVSAALPLVLPQLRRAEARSARQRSAPRVALDVPGTGGRLTIDTAGIGRCGPSPMRVALSWGGRRLMVRCARDLVVRALGALGPELGALRAELDIDRLAPDLTALLLEASLLAALQMAEDATKADIRLVSAEPETEPVPEAGLRLLIDDGERQWGLLVASVEQDRDILADLLSRWPVAPWPAEQLPFPAALRLGTTPLTVAALRSLRPDDAVLLKSERHQGGMLVVAEAWLAEVHRNGETWRLDTALRPARSRQDGEWIMQDGGDGMQDDAIGDPDELPVRLVFDVGRLDMSLGELRRLDAGSVLELNGSADALVRISANGRLIGQGALVDVNGSVGVRIVRIFDLG
jgi:type III secretion protein Q